jgi:hypothetical protein
MILQMKHRTAFVLIWIIFATCTPSDKSSVNLIGKTVEYRYGEDVYHVTLDSDSTLHWEAVAGDETGAKENETYVAEWIEDRKLFITWGEANGIGVSQVLDLEKGKVYNHLLRSRNARKGTGDVRIIEK